MVIGQIYDNLLKQNLLVKLIFLASPKFGENFTGYRQLQVNYQPFLFDIQTINPSISN